MSSTTASPTATAAAGRDGALNREATLIGLHIRQHTPRRKGGAKPQNRLVIRLVAIQATPDPELPWRVTAYDDKHGQWVPYRQANAAYHAADIGYAGLTRERKNQQAIRDLIEEALTAGAFSTAVPLVIFADGEACSGIWPGLNNSSLGHGPLPGASLSHPDLAVVRCVNGERVPQATHRGHGRTPKTTRTSPRCPGPASTSTARTARAAGCSHSRRAPTGQASSGSARAPTTPAGPSRTAKRAAWAKTGTA